MFRVRTATTLGVRRAGSRSAGGGIRQRVKLHRGIRLLGKKRWAIAEGYIPETSHGPKPEITSHETVCILNAGDEDAHVELTIYYTDDDPVGPREVTVRAERTEHVRFNNLDDPEPIPKGTPFASVVESDMLIVCQHTRLDSRQDENALLTTIPYGAG